MVSIGDIFDRMLEPDRGDLSPQHAKYILSLTFTQQQIARYRDLASRHQDGMLNEEELAELDEFVNANTILMLLQAKARRSLQQHPSTPVT